MNEVFRAFVSVWLIVVCLISSGMVSPRRLAGAGIGVAIGGGVGAGVKTGWQYHSLTVAAHKSDLIAH